MKERAGRTGRSGFRVGSVLGFEVRLDASWFILFFLILWSLSAGIFPSATPDRSSVVHLMMGMAGTLLLFASLLLHEISHSIVARTKGVAIRGITLFVFGGLAQTAQEPDEPKDELQIAGVGPVVSLLLGGLFYGVAALGRTWQWSPAVNEVAQYAGFINVMLAVFNLLPGYPLDGGRVFRALAWKRTGDLGRATKWATTGGRWLGLGLIVVGAVEALAGALVGGLWLVFIGMFLRGAAGMAGRQHALTHLLKGVPAVQIMARETELLEGSMTLQELAGGPILRSTRSVFPVGEQGRVVGELTLARLQGTPRDEWASTTVHDVMEPLDDRDVIEPATDMEEVLIKVRASDTGQVFVMDSGTVVGSISRADLAELAIRADALAGS